MTGDASPAEPIAIGPGVTLRRPTAEQALALAHTLALIDPWARYAFDPAHIFGFLSRQEPLAPRYAIVKDGVVAGAVGLHLAWLHGPYLQFLGVCPTHQGQGLGSSVIDWLARTARDDGARNVFVCASDFNTAARRYYEARGFVEVARLPGLIKDGLDEVLLRRRP